jgi:hypothetical protein
MTKEKSDACERSYDEGRPRCNLAQTIQEAAEMMSEIDAGVVPVGRMIVWSVR